MPMPLNLAPHVRQWPDSELQQRLRLMWINFWVALDECTLHVICRTGDSVQGQYGWEKGQRHLFRRHGGRFLQPCLVRQRRTSYIGLGLVYHTIWVVECSSQMWPHGTCGAAFGDSRIHWVICYGLACIDRSVFFGSRSRSGDQCNTSAYLCDFNDNWETSGTAWIILGSASSKETVVCQLEQKSASMSVVYVTVHLRQILASYLTDIPKICLREFNICNKTISPKPILFDLIQLLAKPHVQTDQIRLDTHLL